MIVKSIELHNIQCFSSIKAEFSPITFLKGNIGIGKSTLGLKAHLFAIYGYCDKPLKDFIAKGAKAGYVLEVIEHQGDVIKIKRSYPTSLEIWENDKPLTMSTANANNYLIKKFGDLTEFRQFRIIDNSLGINFLEEGQTTLKKILFSYLENYFNQIRERLQKIKQERERYNKEGSVIYNHYPSEKRLEVINNYLSGLLEIENEFRKEINNNRNEIATYSSQKGNLESGINRAKQQLNKLKANNVCYTCGKGLEQAKRDELIRLAENTIKESNNNVEDIVDAINEIKEINALTENKLIKTQQRVSKIKELKLKLECRLKQIDYKYTPKDVEIAKQAIKEIDKISNYHLVSAIKSLEPIMNSILNKIGFAIEFQYEPKFNIVLTKGNQNYTYNDLSTGQRLFIQIALKLALLLQKGQTGIIIVDEGLANLDKDALNYILTIFQNYPFQVIMMLHRFDDLPQNIKVIDLNKGDKDVQ